jgi:hypothetical protein
MFHRYDQCTPLNELFLPVEGKNLTFYLDPPPFPSQQPGSDQIIPSTGTGRLYSVSNDDSQFVRTHKLPMTLELGQEQREQLEG